MLFSVLAGFFCFPICGHFSQCLFPSPFFLLKASPPPTFPAERPPVRLRFSRQGDLPVTSVHSYFGPFLFPVPLVAKFFCLSSGLLLPDLNRTVLREPFWVVRFPGFSPGFFRCRHTPLWSLDSNVSWFLSLPRSRAILVFCNYDALCPSRKFMKYILGPFSVNTIPGLRRTSPEWGFSVVGNSS